MKGKELKITYDNLDRDIFFCPLIKDSKGRNDFDDISKCAVWEENRTRYFSDKYFRAFLDIFKVLFNRLGIDPKLNLEKDELIDCWKELSNDVMLPLFNELKFARIYWTYSKYPFVVETWPWNAYLSHAPRIRRTWVYDPFENRKKFENVRYKSIDNKEYPDRKAKMNRKKVPVTIHLDPLYDINKTSRVLNENVEEILMMAREEMEKMEKEGHVFRKGVVKNERPRSFFETELRYLGHYRLFKCRGMEFHEVEEIFNKGSEKNKARPLEYDTFIKKVNKILPNLHFKFF